MRARKAYRINKYDVYNKMCGCYSCLKLFPGDTIKNPTSKMGSPRDDEDFIAVCPECKEETVLIDVVGVVDLVMAKRESDLMNSRQTLDICVDFDGTCVKHEYPEIGAEIGAVSVLRTLVIRGHRLILFTMRSGIHLTEAVNWFNEHNIPLYGINTNPEQFKWTKSPKAYGQLYIDDAALGIPLITPTVGRPYVDWAEVRVLLVEKGLLSKSDF